MKVNTALSFLCLGVGLWLAHNDDRKRARHILGLLVVIIAGSTLAEYAFHVNLGIDQLLFRDTRTASLSAYPGRMAVATAFCFLLLGSAVTFLGLKKWLALQRSLVGTCFTFSLVALCGYLYGVKSLYSSTSSSTMAVHTVAGLMAVCLAYFLARPDEGIASIAASDSHSGLLLRTLIPAIVVVPILIGWLRLAGQRANLYDTPFGIALQVLGSIGCLSVLTMLIVRSMDRFELERGRIQEALKESEEKFSKAFRGSPLVVAITRMRDHRYLDVSESFEQWIGWRRKEVIGRTPFDIAIWVDPAERSEFVKRLRAEGVVRNLEFRYRRKDGVEMVGLGSAELIVIGNEQCVISVIADITERKQVEEALRESEERLRLAAQAGKMYAFEWNVTTDLLLRSSECVNVLGAAEPRTLTQQQAMEKIHPDDRPKLLAAVAGHSPENPTVEVTYRVLVSGRSPVWVKSSGRAFFDAEGRTLRVVGMVADVTERKQAEEALSGMTRKLVEAQEQERTRIARELHDDINQRLALLAIELDQLREKHTDVPCEVRDRMHELEQMTEDISSRVYALSQQLYSSIPDSLGLTKGMKSWCREFGKRQKMEIAFKSHDLPRLPQEISLCLFRVLQEALNNAAKHSGVKRIEVQLAEKSGELHLIVTDSGRGFDIEAARQGRGLGLTSMQERVRLVGGTIAIESKPMGGTAIRVCVPLESLQLSQRAAV
jgi:PAS domain S-box-containing protein